MTTPTLRANFAGTWSAGLGGTNAYSYGAPFRVSQACGATELRWYRPSVGTNAPISLRLYDRSSGSLIADAGVPPDSGSVGWQTYALPSAIGLVTGRDYMVTAGFNAGGGEPYAAAASWPSLPAEFTAASFYRYYSSGSNAYPSSGDSLYFYGLDARIDTSITPTPPPPTTSGDLNNSLVAWLADTADNTHRAGAAVPGLPDLTKVVADAIKTTLDDMKADWDAYRLEWTDENNTVNTISTNLTDLLNGVSSTLVDMLNATASWFNLGGKPGPRATIPDQLDTIQTQTATPVDLSPVLTQLQWATGMVLFTGQATSQSSHNGTAAEVWESGEPLHRFTVTAVPPGQGSKAMSNGVTWYPRLGSWAPVMPDGAIGERHFLEFSEQWLFPCPRGATGIAIFAYPGTDWTLEAYSHP